VPVSGNFYSPRFRKNKTVENSKNSVAKCSKFVTKILIPNLELFEERHLLKCSTGTVLRQDSTGMFVS